jgi:FkbM family methyltransferase
MKKFVLSTTSWMARILPSPVKQRIYGIDPLARMIRNILNRAAPTGLTEIKIAAGGAEGMKMRLDLHLEKDFWLGTYENNLQASINDLIEPGWTAFDVGANIGFVSLLFAKKLGKSGKIFAFEALPANLDRLQTHVEINGLDSQVHVISAAVTASSKPVRFLVGPSGAMGKAEGSAGRTVEHRDTLDVHGICLDDFVYRDGNPIPQVIKMDIEGGEVLALGGMKRLLVEAHPLILLELHGPEAARVSWEILSAAGYQIYRMQQGYPPVSTFDELDWKAYIVAKYQVQDNEQS